MTVRLLLLHNIVTPHLTPVLNALASLPHVDLHVAYFAEREAERRWEGDRDARFQRTILPGRQLNLNLAWDSFSFHYNPGLWRFLDDAAPDVLINTGWMSASNWSAFAWCRRHGRPHVLWAGSTARERSLQRMLSLPLVRRLVRGSDAWISYGTASSDYLAALGAERGRIFPAVHAVDNEAFLASLERADPTLRATLGLTDARVLLFVGRLVHTKGLGTLLEAFAHVARTMPRARLLIAGDGAAATAVRADAERLAPGRVVWLGHVALDALPAVYRAADAFVLPSIHEVWGLVLNEAALAGLPLVASSACGASADLVVEGQTGLVVPPGDVDALERAIERVLGDEAGGREMGRRARALVTTRATPDGMAEAMARAARAALRHRDPARLAEEPA